MVRCDSYKLGHRLKINADLSMILQGLFLLPAQVCQLMLSSFLSQMLRSLLPVGLLQAIPCGQQCVMALIDLTVIGDPTAVGSDRLCSPWVFSHHEFCHWQRTSKCLTDPVLCCPCRKHGSISMDICFFFPAHTKVCKPVRALNNLS